METGPMITNPERIEEESFRIIEEELGPHDFPGDHFAVVRRVVHATADFDFVRTLRFHPGAVSKGIAAIRKGADIVVDVAMIQAGISKSLIQPFGGRIHCFISDEDVVRQARESGLTRSILSMRKAARNVEGGIYAIGNAPTALFELLRLIQRGEARPDLVVGVPVGFVSAAESKEVLSRMASIPFITALGRKGGTPVAVAAINALLRLAREESLDV
ncbi:MAG: precorrin-8X methylmutase [Nitrospirae bacterium]|nr:precorrin-8X methylmutase [Nitrospirota bacterium]